MLEKLRIRNVALVEKVDLDFKPGLNVITGETGAGKSILIGSIGLALGDRAHPDVVNEQKAQVEALFTNGKTDTILKREVSLDGRTKAWIDKKQSKIGELREKASKLVELTAQREGATLLDASTHLEHLDRFADLLAESKQLSNLYCDWQSLNEKLKKLEKNIQRIRESEELASFQLNEIESFNPSENEEDELNDEIRILEGAETLILGLSQAEEALDQGETPLSDMLSNVIENIRDLSRIDNSLETTYLSLEEALGLLRQNSMDIAQRRDEIQLDPERLAELRDRRDLLNRLISKYGGNFLSLRAKLEELRSRQSSVSDLVKRRKDLKEKIKVHVAKWEKQCVKLSEKRKKASLAMQKKMEAGLSSLGVEKPVFKIVWQDEIGDLVEFPELGFRRVGEWGLDQIEFYISFNPGFEAKPLQRVASGGELSRVMLLIKGFGPHKDGQQVMVFDEIDTGISGRTARQVGKRLKDLSEFRQVLLVTHLPQIASLADHHINVSKKSGDNHTEVNFKSIAVGSDEQIDEIARLVGGEKVTDSARATAKELISDMN